MVHVFARMEIKSGCMEKFMEILRNNIPNVLAEDGCIRYEACLDVDPATRDKFVSIVETWKSEGHLKAHLATPHMAAFREAAKDLREKSVVTVVEPA